MLLFIEELNKPLTLKCLRESVLEVSIESVSIFSLEVYCLNTSGSVLSNESTTDNILLNRFFRNF